MNESLMSGPCSNGHHHDMPVLTLKHLSLHVSTHGKAVLAFTVSALVNNIASSAAPVNALARVSCNT